MRSDGFVLPAVLGMMLIVGVVSFAMSLVATLELRSARSVANAVSATAGANAGLALALDEIVRAHAAGEPLVGDGAPQQLLGPWPGSAGDATATLELVAGSLAGAAATGIYRLAATATSGSSFAAASLVFALEPSLVLLERR